MQTRKNTLRIVLWILVAIIVLGVLSVCGINFYMIGYANNYTVSPDNLESLENIDCIMVLGCGVSNHAPSPLLADRLRRGIEVYHKGAAPKLLMSGDHGQTNYDEVNIMKQYAMSFGVPESDIFMDHAGFSTYESMYRAKEIFGINRMIIVTQGYHLSRAVYIANRLGITAYGIASDYQTFAGQFYRDCREVLARVKDLFTAIIQPQPTYLGPYIPISGDGTLTNG